MEGKMATPKTTAVIAAAGAILLAGIAAYMVYSYLGAKEQEVAKSKLETQDIVVAATAIPDSVKITQDQLKMARWPKGSLPPGYVSDPKVLEGRMTITPVSMGSPVLESYM